MRSALVALFFFGILAGIAPVAHAQTPVPDTVTYVKAQVLQVLSSQVEQIPGTATPETYQTIKVQILQGDETGEVLTVDNDFLIMKAGDVFYLRHEVDTLSGIDAYSVGEPYRIPTLEFFVGLFILCLFIFGGKQGIRALLGLIASFFLIGYVLLPGILAGYSPVLLSLGVSSLIIVVGSYITHGFNKITTAAVIGMLITICITGALAWGAVHYGQFTGFSTEEASDLSFDTNGSINLVSVLLGSLMIGLLGVLYDAAISQAVAIEELYTVGKHLTRAEVTKRGLRIGREHIGALVNTLAIAYVGASLPLLLLFKLTSQQAIEVTINQELFATEIIRTIIGSIGLILAVPITTLVAVYILYGRESTGNTLSSHHH
jgi:uncharacterized membrane protein